MRWEFESSPAQAGAHTITYGSLMARKGLACCLETPTPGSPRSTCPPAVSW